MSPRPLQVVEKLGETEQLLYAQEIHQHMSFIVSITKSETTNIFNHSLAESNVNSLGFFGCGGILVEPKEA